MSLEHTRTLLRTFNAHSYPGAGVHGACGRNAAQAALADWG